MRKRGEILKRVLEACAETSVSGPALLEAFLNIHSRVSQSKLDWEFEQALKRREHVRYQRSRELKMIRRYHAFVAYLEKENLLVRRKKSSILSFVITPRGRKKLQSFYTLKYRPLPDTGKYAIVSSGMSILVVFDIPEKKAHIRNWLREVLKKLGFEKVQQSVWRGRVRIPEELICDLRRFKVLDCLEIFLIKEEGTLVSRQ